MSIARDFEDAGVDAIKGTEIMEILRLSPEDLSIPKNFQQFREVLSFIKGFSDYRYVLNKITKGNVEDKLHHAWMYTKVAKEHQDKIQQRKDLEGKIASLENFEQLPTEHVSSLGKLLDENKKDINLLEEEMRLFEK